MTDEIERLRAELAAEREWKRANIELAEQLVTMKAERDALRADLDAYQKERDEEVVRLRVELAKERERADAHYRVLECVISKRDELRDLLREAREWIVEGKVDFNDALADRIDAALNKGGGDE